MRSALAGLLFCGAAQAQDVRVVGQPEDDPQAPSASQRALRPGARPGALTDVGELIELSPGAQLRRRGGVGAPVTLTLRGAGGHQVRVLVDGIPLDLARGGAVDLSTLPPGALESITVIRGAQGASFGSGAQGGVLRLKLRTDPAPEVGATIGSFGLAQLDGAGGAGDTLAAIQLGRAAGDFAYRDVNGARRIRQNQDHQRAAALLRHQIGDLRILAQGLTLTRGEPGLEQFEGDGRSITRQGLLGLGWSAGGVEVAGWLMGRRYRFRQTSALLAGQVDRADLTDTRQGVRGRVERRVLGVDAALEATVEREAADARDRLRAALTPSARIGERVQAFGAARLDLRAGRDPIVAPHLGLVAPLGPVELRANVGRLFRDPSIDELYFESAGIRGDPSLRPEDGWGADAGLRWREGPVDLELTAFGQRFDRLILFVPVSAWLIEAQDRFAATAIGLEAALRLRLRSFDLRLTHLEQRARFTDGPPVPFRPDRSTQAQLIAGLGAGFAVFGGGRRTDEVTSDAFGHRTLPGWLRLHAGVRWQGGPWRLSVEGRNLGDATILDALQRPQPGRHWIAALRWQG